MWLRQLFDTISASGRQSGMQYPVSRKQSGKNVHKLNRKKTNSARSSDSGGYPISGSHKKNHAASAQNKNIMIAYHGTASPSNAASIFRHGWLVGSGNAYGDGIYFTQDIFEAKTYAGSGGIYLKCSIYMGKTCHWNSAMEKQYSDWCKAGGVRPDNSAKTSFLIRRGFDTLKAGSIIVVLEPQYSNPTAWKRKKLNIRILSVHRADNDQRIRV